jgi:hypothetical protein
MESESQFDWIAKLSEINLLALIDVLLDIVEEAQLTTGIITIPLFRQVIRFSELLPIDGIRLRDQYCEYRWKVSKLLESKDIIRNVTILDGEHRWGSRIQLNPMEEKVSQALAYATAVRAGRGGTAPESIQNTQEHSAMTKPVIFLGYPFALGYVRPTVEAAADGIAEVRVASDRLRGMPLLHKIEEMLEEADLCIFDLTTHNPNVALEFGLAHGKKYKYAVLYCTDERYNPQPEHESSVFSDIKGWDSIQYRDSVHLRSELGRLLPEYLQALKRPSQLLNVGSVPSLNPPKFPNTSVRPRLYLDLRTIQPRFIAVGSGPVTKLGAYSMGATVKNKGKGPANRVRVYMPGTNHVERLGTLEPNGPEIKFNWSLEDQQIYKEPPTLPIVCVEYVDDDGVKYRQTGPLERRDHSDGTHHYSGNSLEAPIQIDSFVVAYDATGN